MTTGSDDGLETSVGQHGGAGGEQLVSQNDQPADVDRLGVTPYVKALSSYIAGCATPMTIAIQGDWGSGKTSLMKLAKQQLEGARVHVVEFNTWQFSHFDMGDQLIVALISSLVRSVPKEADTSGSRREIKKILGSILLGGGRGLLRGAAKATGLDVVAETVDGMVDAIHRTDDDAEAQVMHPVEAMRRLRDEMQSFVKDACAASNVDRLVIMIDDLDRLPPERAVEMLEILKVFLDVPQCVYVLAIDFEVVKRGVAEKFGADFDERKAFAFFDKIIQVPFQMPMQAYQIDTFLCEALQLPETASSEPVRSRYIELARCAVGTNPRSLKRLANSFALLQQIGGRPSGGIDLEDVQLFAVLCLQIAFPLIHREVIDGVLAAKRELGEDGDDSELDSACGALLAEIQSTILGAGSARTGETSAARDLKLADWSLREADIDPAATLLQTFGAQFPSAAEQDADEDEDAAIPVDAQALLRALNLSAVTMVGQESATPTRASQTYGWDEVESILRDKGKPAGRIALVKRLFEGVAARLSPATIEIATGKGNQVQFCRLFEGQRPVTFCEVVVGTRSITPLFGLLNRHEPGEIQDWRWRLDRVFDMNDAKSQTVMQLRPSAIRNLSDEQETLLIEILAEVHDRLAETPRKFAAS